MSYFLEAKNTLNNIHLHGSFNQIECFRHG
jgi:hypothetical protein